MSVPLAPLAAIPRDICCAQDYENLARRFLAAPTYEYIGGGSGQDQTARANLAAFARWSIYPRLLRDLGAGNTRTMIGGDEFAHPVMLAPVAHQRLAHPRAELDTARGADAVDACMIASTLSSCSLEDIARSAGPQRWFQLYFQPERSATRDLLARAEAAGYRAIVVTLDASIQAASLRALRAGFQLPSDCIAANLAGYGHAPVAALAPGESHIFQGLMRKAPSWPDLDWLMANTSLPVWVKGVLHPADALALRAAGVAGLVVSNHGGRGLDGAPASLAMLPVIRSAVGADYPLLFDGGIRSGQDVFKALALGANAALVGRLQVYALSVAGALGVAHMVKLLREELEVCMALAGCATPSQIDGDTLFSNTD
jgi:isopentenyl diphosphate isomerase/L-lactate dehydrogenase-like FMN-dependent dehydrogenase